jgi:hypothetical protein
MPKLIPFKRVVFDNELRGDGRQKLNPTGPADAV